MKEALDSGNLALRCYLTSCRNFKQGLNEDQQMHDGIVAMAYRLMPMPHFIWVCELHDIRQEGELKCLGEVVWDSTCNRFEWQGLLALHYPELFVLNADSAFENRVTPDESRGWLEIQLQGRDRTAYSPGAANLIDI
ncbi:hypothetical protein [Luteolibacter sp. Populi]|uniref:hypothetical protein n=1 Tax=Luteolibacter sp. Populi TaxID=3230487 RepID=UPI00346572E8